MESANEIFDRVLDNLLGYSAEAHRIAMMLLRMMEKNPALNIIEMLYGGRPWAEVEDASL